jgi:tRNA (mo5U34)-methyltransferase
MDFTKLKDSLAGTQLQALLPFIADDFLDGIRHGDHYRWRRLVANLPSLQASELRIGETVGIGTRTDGEPEQLADLESSLRELIPWRKGPFELFGIHIDSEWQSQLKWARLANRIAPLNGRRVLDVGSGNGYSSFRMFGAGASLVIGLEPHIPYYGQFCAIKHYAPDTPVHVLPLAMEQVPESLEGFDTVFSMGVLYHRRSPLDHLLQLFGQLRPGGQLVMETIYVDGGDGYSLVPRDRYARMNNVWFIPSVSSLVRWLEKTGFVNIEVVDESLTTTHEQRQTPWMPYDSLAGALSGEKLEQTIEGYPAPRRVVVVCDKPGS